MLLDFGFGSVSKKICVGALLCEGPFFVYLMPFRVAVVVDVPYAASSFRRDTVVKV